MRVVKREIRLDLSGRRLTEIIRGLEEDEDGNVEEVDVAALWPCPACGRPVEAEDIRGECTVCGRQRCVTCEGQCAVCGRPLCGHCRVGFTDPPVSVCVVCLQQLSNRQWRSDRLEEEKIAFDRLMNVYAGLLKLAQSGTYERGSVGETLAHISQVRLSRRLRTLARQIEARKSDGRRLLP